MLPSSLRLRVLCLLLGVSIVLPIGTADLVDGPIHVPDPVADALPRPRPELPTVDIPTEWRCTNWSSLTNGQGSCVHASCVMLLRWMELHELAEWWRQSYSGGEYSDRMHQKLTAAGIQFAATTNGDIAFLEWAVRTRRGACITINNAAHMVCLVHLDESRVGILDNNHTDRIDWHRRAEFLQAWQSSPAPWAFTLVYNPPPASPWKR